jgi:hypothetical protein
MRDLVIGTRHHCGAWWQVPAHRVEAMGRGAAIDRLRVARDRDDLTTMIYTAFNAAVTAWHLCDWVFGDMSAEQRDNLKIRHLPDLQEIARRERSLHVCRQIATASKHWEISQFSDPAVSVSVSASPEWNIYVSPTFSTHEKRQPLFRASDGLVLLSHVGTFATGDRRMIRLVLVLSAVIAVVNMTVTNTQAETPDEWINLGARVHGGFGAFIPVGIRIGLDALQRLDAKPREVTVVYYDSEKAPCACLADGIAIATVATEP